MQQPRDPTNSAQFEQTKVAEYFGLDLNNFAASQGMAQLEMYVGHCCCQDQTGDLLLIEKDYVELIIGKGVCPLDHPESVAVDYIEQT